MHDANDINIALVIFGLFVTLGSIGLARFALTRLDRVEQIEIAQVDRDFIARLPAMTRRRSRPVEKY